MTAFSVARSIQIPDVFEWFVVHCCEQREKTAAGSMLRDDIRIYLPSLIIETVYRCRKRKPVRHPLFPGYLFAALDPDAIPDMRRWSRHGVEGLLMRVGMAGTPAVVERQDVEAIYTAEIKGLLRKKRKPKTRCALSDTQAEMQARQISEGEAVRWRSEDALQSIIVRVAAAEPDMRVSILMQMLGGERRISVPLDKVATL